MSAVGQGRAGQGKGGVGKRGGDGEGRGGEEPKIPNHNTHTHRERRQQSTLIKAERSRPDRPNHTKPHQTSHHTTNTHTAPCFWLSLTFPSTSAPAPAADCCVTGRRQRQRSCRSPSHSSTRPFPIHPSAPTRDRQRWSCQCSSPSNCPSGFKPVPDPGFGCSGDLCWLGGGGY